MRPRLPSEAERATKSPPDNNLRGIGRLLGRQHVTVRESRALEAITASTSREESAGRGRENAAESAQKEVLVIVTGAPSLPARLAAGGSGRVGLGHATLGGWGSRYER